ncbi:uroporphyrinogen-III C-methyltransferase [Rugamonas sp.]|uniref:uroporphyrinogen-III C-methyltransferase n=1 Tax=Rugamonas sp. TaxID=1926287 RepID=UPI0025D1A8BA|nr:uroporphyrinogen-III C-methyltransferase [Rugamonas sp.]
MNDLPTLSDPAVSPAAEAPSAPPAPTIATLAQQPLVIAIAIVAILLAAETWSTHNHLRNLREDMAHRLQQNDASNAETGTMARAVQETSKELQAKVSQLEGKQVEAQSQQLALEQLYQDLSKNRDEWALTEIEQVLSTASQQLQLAGNVPGALVALENADRSLSRSDKPQFITIRRAIAKDTEKLKALPSVDSTGVALRIDSVIGQIDALPMLADATLPAPAPVPASAAAAAAVPAPAAKPAKARAGARNEVVGPPVPPASPWLQKVQGAWTEWSGDMWNDVRQLIRVRTVATPDALMLSPSESYFMRENVKLRLLNARMALLSRNETAFRDDLIASQEALNKYFDTRAKATQTVQALLRQVQASNLAIEMPTLSDSLNAVRNYKAKP